MVPLRVMPVWQAVQVVLEFWHSAHEEVSQCRATVELPSS